MPYLLFEEVPRREEVELGVDLKVNVLDFVVFHCLAVDEQAVGELVIAQVIVEQFDGAADVLLVLRDDERILVADEVGVAPNPLVDARDDGLTLLADQLRERRTAFHLLVVRG